MAQVTAAEVRAIANRWSAAWTRDDTEGFAALFTANAVYRDDIAGKLCRSRDELSAFHRHFSGALSEKRMVFTNVFAAGGDACMEWHFTAVQSGTFHGRPPTNRSIDMVGVSVLQVTDEGLIASCTDYYDGRQLAQQLSGD
jgi:steroid delta-isomerase-like uncharacterized protein